MKEHWVTVGDRELRQGDVLRTHHYKYLVRQVHGDWAWVAVNGDDEGDLWHRNELRDLQVRVERPDVVRQVWTVNDDGVLCPYATQGDSGYRVVIHPDGTWTWEEDE